MNHFEIINHNSNFDNLMKRILSQNRINVRLDDGIIPLSKNVKKATSKRKIRLSNEELKNLRFYFK